MNSASSPLDGVFKTIGRHDVTQAALHHNAALIKEFKRNPRIGLDRLLWFVPRFNHILRGGIHTIFRVADHFSSAYGAHHVFVVTDPSDETEIRGMIDRAFPRLNFDLFMLGNGRLEKDLPGSDAAFCTFWRTAYNLVRYNGCKAKFYFVNDFEPAFYPSGSTYALAEQTYRFGFIGIANTPRVGEYYRQYEPWVDCFEPGVDHQLFHPNSNEVGQKSPQRIVFYGRPGNARNAFELGVEALKKVKAKLGDSVRILSVGADYDPADFNAGGVIENLGLLATLDEVAELYRSCDAGLVLMFTPHPSYQPLEFMASGCCTVTNWSTANHWLFRDGENAIRVGTTASLIASGIINVLRDDALRSRVIDGGIRTAGRLTWQRALTRISDFVQAPKPAAHPFL